METPEQQRIIEEFNIYLCHVFPNPSHRTAALMLLRNLIRRQHSRQFPKFIVFHGIGPGGKTTFAKLIQQLFPTTARHVTVKQLTEIFKPFDCNYDHEQLSRHLHHNSHHHILLIEDEIIPPTVALNVISTQQVARWGIKSLRGYFNYNYTTIWLTNQKMRSSRDFVQGDLIREPIDIMILPFENSFVPNPDPSKPDEIKQDPYLPVQFEAWAPIIREFLSK
jgi:hypothetical protein